jgi:O-Antigen ligase
LWYPSFRTGTRVWLSTAVGVVLILNGSRTWFFGALVVLLVFLLLSFRTIVFATTVVALGLVFGIALILNVSSQDFDILGDTSSRIVATLSALWKGQDTSENTGLANLDFRLTIYRNVLEELKSSKPAALLFGHGTSSGGEIVMHVFPQSYKADRLDPNRAIHDEWLRAFYEWGIAGLGLLISVFASLLKTLWSYHQERQGVDPVAALSFLPAFLLAFSTENLLAGAGNAATMSLALIVGLSWIPRSAASKRAAPVRVPRTLGTKYA